ncbi:MAG: sugar ABC transporter permease, partial [Clostridia bacterium]|nr:sugar ABC transporter permease [Clostridia bacterium]
MKQLRYKHKRALCGFGFIAPWLIGFILFFIIPVVNSLVMSFNELAFKDNVLKYTFVGIENFKYALTGDEEFLPYLYESLLDLLINVPIILICSFFFALILKQEFKGNTLMKVVFFLPVILGNGVFAIYQGELMEIQGLSVEMIQSESTTMLGNFTSSGLLEFMREAGLPKSVLNYLTIPI